MAEQDPDGFTEVNMANNAQAYQRGEHPGYEETAWEGIKQTIDVISNKGIKVIVNGGALNPKGLAMKIDELVCQIVLITTPTILTRKGSHKSAEFKSRLSIRG